LGSGDDAELFCNGSHLYLDLNGGIGNFYIRDGTTTRFTFNDNGTLTATAFSGSGASLTALNGSNITTGTVADARIASTLVRTSRSISTGSGLTGGGNLTANRTLSVDDTVVRVVSLTNMGSIVDNATNNGKAVILLFPSSGNSAHNAIGNIKTYYAERAKISVMKGKDNWRTQFDEHMAFIYKIQPDEPGKTRAEVEIKARNSRRGSYYNILGDAIKGDDKNLEGRAVWALERLGASREQINKVMAGRDVRLPTYDYK